MSTKATTSRGTAVSRAYLWIWGAMMVVLGIGSLIANPDFGTGQNVKVGHLFGVLEVNGWHGLAGLVSGIVALAFAPSRRWAHVGAIYIALTSGLIPAPLFFQAGDGGTAAGLIPVDYWDAITLHLIPGIVGVASVVADRLRRRSMAHLTSPAEASAMSGR